MTSVNANPPAKLDVLITFGLSNDIVLCHWPTFNNNPITIEMKQNEMKQLPTQRGAFPNFVLHCSR